MVTVSSSSRMRVVLCWGPSARAFTLALTLCHLHLAEALPIPKRALTHRAGKSNRLM